ncbi:translation initiation factor IF-2, partial [Loa loa]
MCTNPGERDIFDVLDFLEKEPMMHHVLREFVSETIEFETSLLTRLEEAERRLEEFEGRNSHEEMEEELVPQEPDFNEEEAEFAPLPKSDDEAEIWPSGAEWASLPDDGEEEPEVPAAPMKASGIIEPAESIRELVLRSKTIRIPVLATQTTLAAATPEVFHRSDLRDLPEQLRRELQVPETEPYTVVQVEGNNSI